MNQRIIMVFLKLSGLVVIKKSGQLILFLISTAILLFLLIQNASAYDFLNETGRFRITLPASPIYQEGIIPTPMGDFLQRVYIVKHQGSAIGICYFDLPTKPGQNVTSKEILESSRDGALRNTKGILLQEKHINYLGYPALDVLFESMDGRNNTRSRIVLVGKRCYILIVVYSSNSKAPAAYTVMLQTFQVF